MQIHHTHTDPHWWKDRDSGRILAPQIYCTVSPKKSGYICKWDLCKLQIGYDDVPTILEVVLHGKNTKNISKYLLKYFSNVFKSPN